MSHTPGPWAVADTLDNEACKLVHSVSLDAPQTYRGSDICRVWHTRENANLRQFGDANARLIAAAPELLRALQYCEMIIEDRGSTETGGVAFWAEDALKRIRSTIAEAVAQ